MFHLRRINPEDIEELSERELMNQYSLRVLGTDEDGFLICDCGIVNDHAGPDAHKDLPGEKLSEGRVGLDSHGPCRYSDCPSEKAMEVAFQADVYRALDGRVSLKKKVSGGTTPERSSRPLDRLSDPNEEVDKARQEVEKGNATKRRVLMREIEDSDVVEKTHVIPHDFLT